MDGRHAHAPWQRSFEIVVIGHSMSEQSDPSLPAYITRDEMLAIRRRLQAQFAAVPLAYSIDGKTFGYQAPLDYPIPPGGYVEIVSSGGQRYLGQVISKHIEGREGPELAIDMGKRLDIALEGVEISKATTRPFIRALAGEGILLGKATEEGIESPRATDIFEDAALQLADTSLINQYLAGPSGITPLAIGHALYGDETSISPLRARGFARHTFLCGQSGSGKTYSLGVLLERLLLRTELKILIVDPNSDFIRLSDLRPDISDNFDASDVARFASISERIRILRPDADDRSQRLAVRFGDLTRSEQAVVLQLDPLEDREEFSSFWRIVDLLGSEHVELSDVLTMALRDPAAESRQISLRILNLGISDWPVWCKKGEPSYVDLLESDYRALVLDIGTLGLPAEKRVATLALLSQLWRRRANREPVLIVIDEAHNICPAQPEDALQELLTQYVIRIAGEGRKFGLYLLLCSQRPQKIHPNVLSQCDNLILMRMNSSADLAHLSEVFSAIPKELFPEASHFSQGESLIAGQLIQTPTFVRIGTRMTEEGGSDVPTSWTRAAPHDLA